MIRVWVEERKKGIVNDSSNNANQFHTRIELFYLKGAGSVLWDGWLFGGSFAVEGLFSH